MKDPRNLQDLQDLQDQKDPNQESFLSIVAVDLEDSDGHCGQTIMTDGHVYVHGQKSVILDIENGKIKRISIAIYDGEDPQVDQIIEL